MVGDLFTFTFKSPCTLYKRVSLWKPVDMSVNEEVILNPKFLGTYCKFWKKDYRTSVSLEVIKLA